MNMLTLRLRCRSLYLALLVAITLMVSVPLRHAKAAEQVIDDADLSETQGAETGTVWTLWDRDLRALSTDEAGVLWLGGGGGIIRYDLSTDTYERFSSADGLPHYVVYAIAVDDLGNRWFGGDHGLSRLDANGRWRHFDSRNSGLYADIVVGLAVDDSGTVWASHGVAGTQISRRTPDGDWHVFESVEEAVGQDYARVVRTTNTNTLWALAGNEVWTGYQLYDGTAWITRRPAEARGDEPSLLVSDGENNVWIRELANIYHWNGTAWQEEARPPAEINRISVVDGLPWIGWRESSYPLGGELAHIAPLHPTPHISDGPTRRVGPIVAIAAFDDMVVAIGDGWIRLPDGSVTDLYDVPSLKETTDAFHLPDNEVWIASRYQNGPWISQALQQLRHAGTTTVADDSWSSIPLPPDELTIAEPSSNGDVWAISHQSSRNYHADTPYRWGGQAWQAYPLPGHTLSRFSIPRIYVEDDCSVWFLGYAHSTSPSPRFIFHLAGGCSSRNAADDTWTIYPVDIAGYGGDMAVDRFGRPLFFNAAGLYRYKNNEWQLRYSDRAICAVIPAADGEFLIVADEVADCRRQPQVLAPEGEGVWAERSLPELCRNRLPQWRSAIHPNPYWAVDHAGTIWYPVRAEDDGATGHDHLHHCVDGAETVHAMPLAASSIARFKTDRAGQPWLLAEGKLWRMSEIPDFDLAISPNTQIVLPGDEVSFTATIIPANGFDETVNLEASFLDDGITATLDPVAATPDEPISLHLEVDAEQMPGRYPFGLFGDAGVRSHAVRGSVLVVEEIHRQFIALIYSVP